MSRTHFTPDAVEEKRAAWAAVAKERGWYSEPFYVQVWVDPETTMMYDSVAYVGLDKDVVIYESEGEW